MEKKGNQTRCVTCGDTLVPSRKFIASTYMYWNRPWGSMLKMSVPVTPYACMTCGRVYLYLSDKNKIIREFNELPEEERENHKEE